ncbi:MAG: hypothetical protein KF851_17195 [Pirellulaceae bacterium]|nr:hypothetical protein [Pirellulaceae bacterium]
MAILCLVSETIRQDASRHGVPKGKLDEFASEIEKTQSLSQFDHFPPPCLVKKKKFGYKNRMIGVLKYVGDHSVVVMLRMIMHGGAEKNDYRDFQVDPAGWAGKYFDKEFGGGKLQEWVAERTKVELPAPAPPLSIVESTFLWTDATANHDCDTIVCETEQWIDAVRDSKIDSRLVRLPELIAKCPEFHDEVVYKPAGDPRLTVHSYYHSESDHLLLLSVSYGADKHELDALRSEWSEKLQSVNVELLLRYSRRSYPLLICYDEDMWLNVERQEQANLALSPEEGEILRSCSLSGSQDAVALPLFINGRAGSGKSTLLQYLFAECIRRWDQLFDANPDCRPLYFASNETLLHVARRTVHGLLKANSQHLLREQQLSEACVKQLDNVFLDTLKYFHSLLPNDATQLFRTENYFSYATFRRKWKQRFGNEPKAVREYGPQLSWHVIRGLIKGLSVEDELEIDEYDDLPKEERTVSRKSYESVFTHVWKAWYEPLRKGGEAWDSQDLVRHLLDKDLIRSEHVAIFCDEAQDFTRLELEALYRVSIFANRSIEISNLGRIPFIFAGDPFQTLNPTGFRWESVKAAFTERIMSSLARYHARTEMPQLRYRELTYNYRSAATIVSFCNTIQALRASLFDHKSLLPQSTWQESNSRGSLPVFFEKGDVEMEEAVRKQSDLIIIVPCEEGEEAEYVANDSYLKSLVSFTDTDVPQNVFSAAKSKGLEFRRVLLYGWADRKEATSLAELFQKKDKPSLEVEARLELEYFMNNLYVAASRAQKRLFVVDARDSRDKFWWFSKDTENIGGLVNALPNRDAWMKGMGILAKGVADSFRDDHDDSQKLAEQFEGEGRTKQDPYLLRQAAYQYERLDNGRKLCECRGYAFLFEGSFADAGHQFDLAGKIEVAIESYWRGECYGELAQLAVKRQDVAKLPECRIATAIVEKNLSYRAVVSVLQDLLDRSGTDVSFKAKLIQAEWNRRLDQVVKRAIEGRRNKNLDVNTSDARELVSIIDQLYAIGVRSDKQMCCTLLMEAEEYKRVIELIDDETSELVREARTRLALQKKKSKETLTADEMRLLGEFYLKESQIRDAVTAFGEAKALSRVMDALQMAIKSTIGIGDGVFEQVIDLLIYYSDWANAASLIIESSPSAAKWTKGEKQRVADLVKSRNLILTKFLPAVAGNIGLHASLDSATRDLISGFLRQEFVDRGIPVGSRTTRSLELIGQAIENLGKDIDALKYYENWKGNSSLPATDKAERRWIAMKLRQADREEREGKSTKARQYREDAKEALQERGWTEEDLDRSPIASRANTIVAAKDDSILRSGTGKLNQLSVSVFPQNRRVNITHLETGDIVQIRLDDRHLTSSLTRKHLSASTLSIEEWSLTLTWNGVKLILEQAGQKLVVE